MPPKKKKSGKGKKGKSKGGSTPTIIDGVLSSEMTAEELLGHYGRLELELEKERSERNLFQLERDKINTFWEITKKQVEETRSEIRNKDREIEETEEKHQIEIKVYEQKFRHLIYEHKQKLAELRAQGFAQIKLNDEEHRYENGLLRSDNRVFKCDLKEQQLSNEDKVKDLKLSYENQITEIRMDFELQVSEIETKFRKRTQTIRDEMDVRRKHEIHEIEERKNMQINILMKNHEKAFSDIKNYYNDITLNNLALINTLKEQMEEMTKRQERTEKSMSEIMSENKKLVDPLKKAQDENGELRRQLNNYEKDKVALKNTKARLKIRDQDMKDLEFEHEVIEQRFKKVQGERDDLYEKFVKAILEVQQKTGLKNILLERKLMTLNDSLEKKEAQLNEVLSASNLDPNALAIVTRKLEDVLDSKNSAIKDLQYELARVCKAHNDELRTYEAKLSQFGIPVEELGFKPLESTVGNQSLGYGPAGLVSVPP